jgi:hypothetical protein
MHFAKGILLDYWGDSLRAKWQPRASPEGSGNLFVILVGVFLQLKLVRIDGANVIRIDKQYIVFETLFLCFIDELLERN